MAVTSPGKARDALRLLVGDRPVAARAVLHDPYLPPPMQPGGGLPLRMDENEPIGGYGAEARYVFPPAVAGTIAGRPADVLEGRPSIDTDDTRVFVTASLDLTMQGGTTSGVIYPLAVCELATRFRFRNVGGASAGAIAAAFTAAAELGRSEALRGHSFPPPAPGAPPSEPTFRRGFTGLADVMAWLTQTRPSDDGPDEFRLAQLFRPGRSTHPIFRVLSSAMRGRTWPLPLLAVMAFGVLTRVITAVLLLGTFVLTGWVGRSFVRSIEPWYVWLGWGVLETVAFVGTLIGVILVLQSIVTELRTQRQKAASSSDANTPVGLLRGVTSGAPTAERGSFLFGAISGVVLLALVVTLAWAAPLRYLAGWFLGLAGAFVVIVVLLVSVLRYILALRTESYGLIAGTEPQRGLSLLDRLAKTPKPTVGPSLVPWLSDSLSQLAGLPAGEVLRFGHLWDGVGYTHDVRPARPVDLARWQQQADDTDCRLVNLELMTTDLTRRRPYRFPLQTADLAREPLYLQLDELAAAGVFPAPVIDALRQAPTTTARVGTDRTVVFHQLPDPWDLPVVFAVRLSMALPMLFEAVRMYRLRQDTVIKDDFGRDVMLNGVALTTLTVTQPIQQLEAAAPQPPPPLVAEELWFSDGGITSNFPVHFFDAALPRWPTVSLNLGTHPETDPLQDIWVPQDWDPVPTPVEPLSGSGLSLFGAVLETAMSWRDSMQSAMPGYRNRIAQVRTRPDEGGTNLFMSRDAVASMGLRGAIAGARLRTRFGNQDEWNRFRWMRLRVALSDLERVRADTKERRGFYADALRGPEWLSGAENGFLQGAVPPHGLTWYDPLPGFWPAGSAFLNIFADGYQPADHDVLTERTPQPEPVLRQVPRE